MVMALCNYCKNQLVPELNLGERPIVNKLSLKYNEIPKKFLVQMTICKSCGLHQVIHKISPELFYSDYMTPSSWKHEPHIFKLISEIESLTLPVDNVIDIGCNDGKFLKTMESKGSYKLFGIEPTKNTSEISRILGIMIINDFFDLSLANKLRQEKGKFGLVLSRQVLEHVSDIKDFLLGVKALLHEDGYLILEVPDSEINFSMSDYGIWEEHLNYFTKTTLTRILLEMGWEIVKWYRSIFSGWCQTLIVKPVRNQLKEKIEFARVGIDSEVKEFTNWASNYDKFKSRVFSQLDKIVGENGRIGLFGVGSRSLSTIYSLGLIDRVSEVYDDNVEKIGKFIPGTRLKIKDSAELLKDRIDLILLGVNMENEAVILDRLQGLSIPIFSILPPSEQLLWNFN
jgi:2-polyprenyl-3-methyl-5-hydroxy-6-metoxy-1,4-benzoquinol methylase